MTVNIEKARQRLAAKRAEIEAQGLEQLYALHDAAGERLALVRDRSLAFMLARQNDLAPVSVH